MKIVVHVADTEDGLPDSSKPHYYTEVADNGEVVSTSELYANRGNALRAAKEKSRQYVDRVRIEFAWLPKYQ